jgi:hypothetical protein
MGAAIGWLCVFVMAGASFDLGAGLRATTSAGLLSGGPDQDSDLAATQELIPALAQRLRDPTQELVVRYFPRLFLRYPGASNFGRPLLLHQVGAGYENRLSRRARFHALVYGAAGELDYSSQRLLFDESSAAVGAEAIDLGVVRASSGLELRLTPRSALRLGAGAGHQASLSARGTASAEALPTTSELTTQVFHAYLLSRRDAVGTALAAGYYTSDRTDSLIAGGLELHYERALNRSTGLLLSAGVAVSSSVERSEWRGFPLAMFGLTSETHESALSLRGGVRATYDALLASYHPQAFVEASGSRSLGRDWQGALQLFAASALREAPQADERLESVLALALPFDYRMSQNASIEFGIRLLTRGARLDDALERRQTEAVGFLGLRYVKTSAKDDGAWVQ